MNEPWESSIANYRKQQRLNSADLDPNKMTPLASRSNHIYQMPSESAGLSTLNLVSAFCAGPLTADNLRIIWVSP